MFPGARKHYTLNNRGSRPISGLRGYSLVCFLNYSTQISFVCVEELIFRSKAERIGQLDQFPSRTILFGLAETVLQAQNTTLLR